ncbi:polyketide cyclase [Streptomyces sp. NPDC088785]|uniref:polyketide cyclase n=1 Tax=Streptomyces sp. NPDC088785 TaxID=3365897 RepID=UPI0038269187
MTEQDAGEGMNGMDQEHGTQESGQGRGRDSGQDHEPDHEPDRTSAVRTVPAPVARVFAVLADPAAHGAIDGTGWVRRPVDRAPLTEPGQVFRMGMYHSGHPDGTYVTANRVHVLEPPHAIGWFTGTERDDGGLDFGGWFWRYDLAPLGPDRTRVTLTYDWSAVPDSVREYLTFPPFPPGHLTDSLSHLAALVAREGPES